MSEEDKYDNGPKEWPEFAERLKKYMEHHGDGEYDALMAHFEEEEWTDNLGGLHEDYKEGPGEALCINGLELPEEDEARLNQRIDDVLMGKDDDIKHDEPPKEQPPTEEPPEPEPKPEPTPDPEPTLPPDPDPEPQQPKDSETKPIINQVDPKMVSYNGSFMEISFYDKINQETKEVEKYNQRYQGAAKYVIGKNNQDGGGTVILNAGLIQIPDEVITNLKFLESIDGITYVLEHNNIMPETSRLPVSYLQFWRDYLEEEDPEYKQIADDIAHNEGPTYDYLMEHPPNDRILPVLEKVVDQLKHPLLDSNKERRSTKQYEGDIETFFRTQCPLWWKKPCTEWKEANKLPGKLTSTCVIFKKNTNDTNFNIFELFINIIDIYDRILYNPTPYLNNDKNSKENNVKKEILHPMDITGRDNTQDDKEALIKRHHFAAKLNQEDWGALNETLKLFKDKEKMSFFRKLETNPQQKIKDNVLDFQLIGLAYLMFIKAFMCDMRTGLEQGNHVYKSKQTRQRGQRPQRPDLRRSMRKIQLDEGALRKTKWEKFNKMMVQMGYKIKPAARKTADLDFYNMDNETTAGNAKKLINDINDEEEKKRTELDDSDIFFHNDNFPLQIDLCIIPKEGMDGADDIIKALRNVKSNRDGYRVVDERYPEPRAKDANQGQISEERIYVIPNRKKGQKAPPPPISKKGYELARDSVYGLYETMVKAFVTCVRDKDNTDDNAPKVAKKARRRDDRFVMLIDRRDGQKRLYVFPPHIFNGDEGDTIIHRKNPMKKDEPVKDNKKKEDGKKDDGKKGVNKDQKDEPKGNDSNNDKNNGGKKGQKGQIEESPVEEKKDNERVRNMFSYIAHEYNDITNFYLTNECMVPNGNDTMGNDLEKNPPFGVDKFPFVLSAHFHKQRQWHRHPKLRIYQYFFGGGMRFFHRHNDEWLKPRKQDQKEEKELTDDEKKKYKKLWTTYKIDYKWDKDITELWPKYFVNKDKQIADCIRRPYDHGDLSEEDAKLCWSKLKQYNAGGSANYNQDDKKDNNDENEDDLNLSISDLEIFDNVFDLYKCDAQYFQWDNAVKRQLKYNPTQNDTNLINR